jgi:hypothetical protein
MPTLLNTMLCESIKPGCVNYYDKIRDIGLIDLTVAIELCKCIDFRVMEFHWILVLFIFPLKPYTN